MATTVFVTPAYANDEDTQQAEVYLSMYEEVDQYGETVTLTVCADFSKQTQISTMDFEIYWEKDYQESLESPSITAFDYVSISPNSSLSPNDIFINTYENGLYYSAVRIGYSSVSSGATFNGSVELFSIELSVNESLPDGNYSFYYNCKDMFGSMISGGEVIFDDVYVYESEGATTAWVGERLSFNTQSMQMLITRENSQHQILCTNKKLEDCWSSDVSVFRVLSWEYNEDHELTYIYLKGNSTGKATIYASSGVYGDVIASCEVTVVDEAPALMQIYNQSDVITEYAVGEEIDLTGLKLKLLYWDYGTEIIESGYKVGEYDFSTPGEKTVTISYKNMVSAKLNVTVYDIPQLTGEYETDEQSKILYGVKIGTTAEELLEEAAFSENSKFSLQISDSTSQYSGKLSTGKKLDVLFNSRAVKTYTIAVEYDINGDGKCNILDLMIAKKAVSGISELTDIEKKAAAGEGAVNAQTLVKMQKHILLKED